MSINQHVTVREQVSSRKKNHSTTLLDLSLGVQPPERVWQGLKETASPQYRPDDRMMLEQKAFAPPLELDSAYRIRKTG